MKLGMRGGCALAVLCGVVFSGQRVVAQTAVADKTHKASGMLQLFGYPDVVLTAGPMGMQAEGARDFYLSLSEDNLLNGFRKRACVDCFIFLGFGRSVLLCGAICRHHHHHNQKNTHHAADNVQRHIVYATHADFFGDLIGRCIGRH